MYPVFDPSSVSPILRLSSSTPLLLRTPPQPPATKTDKLLKRMPSVDHLQASEDSPLADQDAFTAESAGDSSSDALTVGAGAMLHELDPLASLSQKIARAVDVTACSRDLDVDASIHPLERLARHLDAGTASAHAVDPKTGIKLAVPLDAARWHLPRIAAFLRSFVRRGERRAVFWDVCSLPADAGHTGAFVHDDGERWEQGAPEEEEESGEASSGSASGSASGSPHRQKSLEGMAMLFSHPEVWVALQTAVPPGNHVPFVSRGLSFLHTSLAGLVRPGGRTLDLAAFEGKFDVVEAFQGALVESTVQQKKRTPPVIPESFERLLAEKSVRHDAERRALARLYRESFRVRIELAASLSYEGFGWGDAEMRVVVRALLYRGGLHRLKSLSLKGNAITDAGAASLARVINLRACPMLSHINLASNRIGRDGELLLATCQREQLSQHGFVVHFDTSRNELKDVLRGVPSDPLRDRDGLLRKELEEAKARFKDVRATVRAEFERALSR